MSQFKFYYFYPQTFGVAAAFTFFMVQFEQAKNPDNPWGQPWLETENN